MYVPDCISKEDLDYFKKAGAGKRVGFGKKAGLVIVDMTRGYTEDIFPNGCSKAGQPAIKANKKLLNLCRELSILTVFTKDFPGSFLETGCWGDKMFPTGVVIPPEAYEFPDELKPNEDEIVMPKAHSSAFFGTQLASILIHERIDTLLVTGMVTSGCVRATAVDAFSYNYKVIVPLECVADRGVISHQVSLFDIDQKYGDVMELSEVLEQLKTL